jgi:2-aminobenzoate-CoA ligase
MPLLRPGEIATVIERAEISHAIVDSRFIGDFREAVEQTRSVKNIVKYDGDYGNGELETRTASLQPLPPVDTHRDDPALVAFTSGTTGVPKGCVQFHRDVLAPCDSFASHLIEMGPGDIAITSAPLAFTFGLGAGFLFPLRAGAACATIEQPSPPAMLEAIANHGITHLGTAPTAYKAMLSQPLLDNALKTLRYCLSAGEHLPEATWRAWHERTGIAITDGIGSTELMHIFVSAAGDDPPQLPEGGPRLRRPSSTRTTARLTKAGRLAIKGRPAAAASMTRASVTMSSMAGT